MSVKKQKKVEKHFAPFRREDGSLVQRGRLYKEDENGMPIGGSTVTKKMLEDNHPTMEWKEIKPFYHFVLQYLSYSRSYQGTVTFLWTDVMTGAIYPVNLRAMDAIMAKANFQESGGAIVDGKFAIRHSSSGFSLFLLEE